ncbi:hypothetical protein CBM2599_B51009 [Cupriavidus taiwanensis]|nr:hypothetical protein CBM2599_B51009 [Cupriavidus taiwanensis]
MPGAAAVRQRFEQVGRGDKEQAAGDSPAEIEQPVVVAGRPADEHVLEHLLDRGRRAGVGDEVGAEFARTGAAKHHVVAQDLDFLPVVVERGQRAVRVRWLDTGVQLDVRQLPAADDQFLRLDRQRVPPGHVVQVLLHHDVAAAGEPGVFFPDHREARGFAAGRIFCAVHETDHRAHVEVAKAMHLVDHPHRVAQLAEQLRGQLEAKVHRFGADVQQQIARRCRGHALAGTELAEAVQRSGTGRAEEPVPGVRAEAADTGQVAVRYAMADCTHHRRDVGAPCTHGFGVVIAIGKRCDEEYRAAGDGVCNGLGFWETGGHRYLLCSGQSVGAQTGENSAHKRTRTACLPGSHPGKANGFNPVR